ncbi:MAG: methyl-accepting chemotaxis protein, partial [Planctomycetota bacterium]
GLGFKVVADEVCKLATRSDDAARKIANLAKESMGRVKEGRELSIEAKASVLNILAGLQETIAQVREISTATDEQQADAQQVIHAVNGVAQTT